MRKCFFGDKITHYFRNIVLYCLKKKSVDYVCSLVIGCDSTDRTTWVSGGESVGWYVVADNAAGSDNCSVAYGHARKDYCVGAYPNVVSYGHRTGFHYSFAALCCIKCMLDGVYSRIRSDKYIVAYAHLGFVEYRKVVVAYEAAAYPDVEAEIAVEWRMDGERLSDST